MGYEGKLITYADLNYSNYSEKSTVYNNTFKYVKHTTPNYYYFQRNDYRGLYHRYNFRKDKLVREGFDSNKTEWEIMQERGFDRIWDCGSIKYELIL